MRKHGMKRFVLLSLLALLPVLLVVAFYIIRDPFHVIIIRILSHQGLGAPLA